MNGGVLYNTKQYRTIKYKILIVKNNSDVSQASLSINNRATNTNAELAGVDIKSKNVIRGLTINKSNVKQSNIELNGDGVVVSNLHVEHTNTIKNNDITNSNVTQAEILIKGNAQVRD